MKRLQCKPGATHFRKIIAAIITLIAFAWQPQWPAVHAQVLLLTMNAGNQQPVISTPQDTPTSSQVTSSGEFHTSIGQGLQTPSSPEDANAPFHPLQEAQAGESAGISTGDTFGDPQEPSEGQEAEEDPTPDEEEETRASESPGLFDRIRGAFVSVTMMWSAGSSAEQIAQASSPQTPRPPAQNASASLTTEIPRGQPPSPPPSTSVPWDGRTMSRKLTQMLTQIMAVTQTTNPQPPPAPVPPSSPIVSLSPTSLSFMAQEGGRDPLQRELDEADTTRSAICCSLIRQ